MRTMVRAYIGLGSNLGDRQGHLDFALARLAELPVSRVAAHSPVYRSRPLDDMEQPDYFNAVAALDTTLPPLELLDALQAIERAAGRERTGHWAPRTLDLDLLLYGEAVIDHPRLTVPHPGIAARDFVLQPLHDLDPDLVIPAAGSLATLLEHCPQRGLTRVEAAP